MFPQLDPLSQIPPASQLSPQLSRASWRLAPLPLVGLAAHSPSLPGAWSPRATQLGNYRGMIDWVASGPPWCPQTLLLPLVGGRFLGKSQPRDLPATSQDLWPPTPREASWPPGKKPRWLALPGARGAAWAAGPAREVWSQAG